MDLIHTQEQLWAALPSDLKGCVGWYLQWRSLCIRRLDRSEVREPIHIAEWHNVFFANLEMLAYNKWGVDPVDQRFVLRGHQLRRDEPHCYTPLSCVGWDSDDAVIHLVTFEEVNGFKRGTR